MDSQTLHALYSEPVLTDATLAVRGYSSSGSDTVSSVSFRLVGD